MTHKNYMQFTFYEQNEVVTHRDCTTDTAEMIYSLFFLQQEFTCWAIFLTQEEPGQVGF